MNGNITRRGAHSWRLKYEAGERDPLTGRRQTRYATVRGTKREAQAELIRLLATVEAGTAVAPDRTTLAADGAEEEQTRREDLADDECDGGDRPGEPR